MSQLSEMKKSGLIIDDIPEEFTSFVNRNKQEGKYAVRKQLWERMTEETRSKYLEHSHPAIYDDKHLKPLSDKQLESHLGKVVEDLEVNKDNYKPFYPPKQEQQT